MVVLAQIRIDPAKLNRFLEAYFPLEQGYVQGQRVGLVEGIERSSPIRSICGPQSIANSINFSVVLLHISYIFIDIDMYVCMCVYMYIYIYINHETI